MVFVDGRDAGVGQFWIEPLEITVDRFMRWRRDAGAPRSECNWIGREAHPVNCVTLREAQAFCDYDTVGGALPTRDQWLRAAGGPEGRTYPWGDAGPLGRACFNLFQDATTCAVGSFPSGATPDCLEDLSGNVAEWVSMDGGASHGYSLGRPFDLYPPPLVESGQEESSAESHLVGFRCVAPVR